MTARVLVAGVGNVFFGDDGFGVEVVRRLAAGPLPEGTRVVDFGIRTLHFALDLLSPPEFLLVLDLAPRGGTPGTLYVIEPDLDEAPEPAAADAHGMSLPAVFATVRLMGGVLPRVRVIGCEPSETGEQMGLSTPVLNAVAPAAQLVLELIDREFARPRHEEVSTCAPSESS